MPRKQRRLRTKFRRRRRLDAEGEEDEENGDNAPNPEETYAEQEIEGDFD